MGTHTSHYHIHHELFQSPYLASLLVFIIITWVITQSKVQMPNLLPDGIFLLDAHLRMPRRVKM